MLLGSPSLGSKEPKVPSPVQLTWAPTCTSSPCLAPLLGQFSTLGRQNSSQTCPGSEVQLQGLPSHPALSLSEFTRWSSEPGSVSSEEAQSWMKSWISSPAHMPSDGKQGSGEGGQGTSALTGRPRARILQPTVWSDQQLQTQFPIQKYIYTPTVCLKSNVSHQGFFFLFPMMFPRQKNITYQVGLMTIKEKYPITEHSHSIFCPFLHVSS